MERYADIILPLAQSTYTFHAPQALGVSVGDAVVVPFGSGRDKFYTGIVLRVHSERPNFKNIKSIERKVYSVPLLTELQLKVWQWVASYYMSTIGEVMRVALPSMMKPSAWSEEEYASEEYAPREEAYITLCKSELSKANISSLERRAPKQHKALNEIKSLGHKVTPRRLLRADMATLRALTKRGYILIEMSDPLHEAQIAVPYTLPQLTEAQDTALQSLITSFESHSTALLYGVTGSGKTEIYIHLIAKALERGEDVLMMLPEIALTAQLVERMERTFGSRVVVYHSRLSPKRRTEVYLQLNNRAKGGNFVIGVRSAIFLPLKRLGLIIVDEEHDASYKQAEPAPRYNSRDVAVAMASMMCSHTLLGSATPSLESWVNAQSGKYGLAELTERYGDAVLPKIILSDTIRAVKRGERRSHFNFSLLERLKERLERGEQSILFQNRRGFAPYVECGECAWTPRCPHCNVSLTMHKSSSRLSCHYCGYQSIIPTECPECHSQNIKPMGFGTEKIEEQLTALLPSARITRLDRDTATSQSAINRIIEDFAEHRSDILVGTQMVTKGFDFESVTLVGVLNADNLLHNPDFRAEERAFQLLMQVAGRAGRRSAQGEVVIQSTQIEHRVLQHVVSGDYPSIAHELLSEREAFSYPPYGRITVITMRHRNRDVLYGGANYLASTLRATFGRRLQGPVTPAVDRIRDEYLVVMNLKIEAGASSTRAREILRQQIDALHEVKEYKYIDVICDVDAQ